VCLTEAAGIIQEKGDFYAVRSYGVCFNASCDVFLTSTQQLLMVKAATKQQMNIF